MTLQDGIVLGAIILALIYLAAYAYRRYRKEARQLEACESCPIVKQRDQIASELPPLPNSLR